MQELDQLEQDFLNFSKLHSWYKKLDFYGDTIYFYQEYGIQNQLTTQKILDKDNLHWYFSFQIPENKKYYTTKCGPFLRGEAHFTIIECDNRLIFKDWFLNTYPEYYHKYYKLQRPSQRQVIEILVAESERNKYWETTKNAFLAENKINII